jgi:predicted ribosome quality control (RQC) complex YloA/Tae2 family protein
LIIDKLFLNYLRAKIAKLLEAKNKKIKTKNKNKNKNKKKIIKIDIIYPKINIPTLRIMVSDQVTFVHDGCEYTLWVGKNKKSNWDLIDGAKETDIWFHVGGNAPSAHVILETDIPISKIPRQVIKRCACICKSHSSSKSEKRCPIIYTTIRHVTKTSIVGQVNVDTSHVKQVIL